MLQHGAKYWRKVQLYKYYAPTSQMTDSQTTDGIVMTFLFILYIYYSFLSCYYVYLW